MKKLFLLLFLFAGPAFAGPPYSIDINTATDITTSYVAASITGITVGSHFTMVNGGSSGVCCDTQDKSTSVPPVASNGHELCIPANWSQSYDSITINGNIYCRNQSSNSGTLSVQVW